MTVALQVFWMPSPSPTSPRISPGKIAATERKFLWAPGSERPECAPKPAKCFTIVSRAAKRLSYLHDMLILSRSDQGRVPAQRMLPVKECVSACFLPRPTLRPDMQHETSQGLSRLRARCRQRRLHQRATTERAYTLQSLETATPEGSRPARGKRGSG